MHYQPNLKGASAPLAFIIIIVILIVGGLLYFTAQAPEETPPSISEESGPLPSPAGGEMLMEEEEEPKEEVMTTDSPEEKKEVAPSEKEAVTPPAVKTFDITGRNFAFSQSEIRVKKGDKVRINFTSTDGFHDWTVDEFNASTKEVNTGGNASVEFIADTAGTFEYYCSVGSHRQMGMRGNLIVE